jgi:hypothetical protein
MTEAGFMPSGYLDDLYECSRPMVFRGSESVKKTDKCCAAYPPFLARNGRFEQVERGRYTAQ